MVVAVIIIVCNFDPFFSNVKYCPIDKSDKGYNALIIAKMHKDFVQYL